MSKIDELLNEVEVIVKQGINKEGVIEILNSLKCYFPYEILDKMKLYGDYLPKNNELEFSEEKRYLHFFMGCTR